MTPNVATPLAITVKVADGDNSNTVLWVGVITSITALVGALGGSYITAVVAEKNRRRLDAAALAAGLAGELSSSADGARLLRAQLMLQIEAMEAGEVLRLRRFQIPGDVFFESNVERVGLLGPELVESVVYVYNNVRAFRIAYMLIGEQHQEMAPDEIIVRLRACLGAMDRALERGATLVPRLHAMASTCAAR